MKLDNQSSVTEKSMAEAIVTALYSGFLGRLPDAPGLVYWTEFLERTSDLSGIVNAIISGSEYAEKQGAVTCADRIKRQVAEWSRANLEQPLVIVDVGAQKLADEAHIYSAISVNDIPHRIVGFEPLQHRIEEALAAGGHGNISLLPVFIGDGGSSEFHVNQPDSTSSLLPFNQEVISDFVHLSNLYTANTEEIKTRTLDEALSGEETVDFLKLDIQGFELKALQSSPQVLKRTGVVHCEVSFMEIYKGQALFSELELFMRQSGFTFVDFSHLCRYAYHGDHTGNLDRLGWGDAVFMRDMHNATPRDLLVQSLIALFVYNKLSLAQSLAKRYDLLTGASFAALLQPEGV